MTTRSEYQEQERSQGLSLILGDTVFKIIRRLVEFVLPASGAFYFALAQIWGLAYAEEVVGTIAAVTVFLAAVVGISRTSYNNSGAAYDGELVVDTHDPERDVYSLEVTTPVEELSHKQQLTLRVRPTDPDVN